MTPLHAQGQILLLCVRRDKYYSSAHAGANMTPHVGGRQYCLPSASTVCTLYSSLPLSFFALGKFITNAFIVSYNNRESVRQGGRIPYRIESIT
jgi:hypothetical protein